MSPISDYRRITVDADADDRAIGYELPYREQETDDAGHVTDTTTIWEQITFAAPAMLPRDVRTLVIQAYKGAAFDPEEFLIAAAADDDNRRTMEAYLERDGVSLRTLDDVASKLMEAYSGRGKAKVRRS